MLKKILILLAVLAAGAGVGALIWKNTGNRQAGSPAAGKFYEIPEAGLKFRVPENFGDPERFVQQFPVEGQNATVTVAFLSSRELREKGQAAAAATTTPGAAGACSAQGGPLGAVVRLNELPQDPNRPVPPDTKDFGNFIGYYIGPQAVCSPDQKVAELQDSQVQKLLAAIPSLETLDGNQGRQFKQSVLEGSLSYPGGDIPPSLKTCAENLDTKKLYCTKDQLQDQKFSHGKGYMLFVPEGRYQVFSTPAENPREPGAIRAYYSQAVACGLKADCTDHSPITVEAKSQQTQGNIDPQDWHSQPG
jgi:hypothetical protein